MSECELTMVLRPLRGVASLQRRVTFQEQNMLDIEECLWRVMAIRGALGASLIDYTTGTTVSSAGRRPNDNDDITGAGAADVVRATVDRAAFASTGRPGRIEDIVITSSNGYHIVQFVATPFDARLVLYVWLDRVAGDVATTRRSLHAIAQELVAG